MLYFLTVDEDNLEPFDQLPNTDVAVQSPNMDIAIGSECEDDNFLAESDDSSPPVTADKNKTVKKSGALGNH